MAEWEPIKRAGAPDVRGVHPQRRDRLDVVISLSASPPAEWERLFDGHWAERAQRRHFREMGVPMPSIEGSSIRFAPQDKELEGWVEGIDASIEEVNGAYERTVLPRIRQLENADRRAQEENERRVEEARRRAKEL